MVTRRRGVKNSYNKTRTIIKASLRKTRHKNKKSKHRKTKKRYQNGGGPQKPKTPKARAKGDNGVPAEYKVVRELIRKGLVPPDTLQKQANWHRFNNTAEFDLDKSVTGLPHHISVKSVQKKSEGQNSFTIMCGKSDRFFGQTGLGDVPYHMVVVIREKHPTDPNKTQHRALDIDLRTEGKKLLFGSATDCKIKEIVERAQLLSDAYCKNDEDAVNNSKIDQFNSELKGLGAKIQLAPKKGNPDKKRPTRAQASIAGFNPNSPRSRASIIEDFLLSSEPKSDKTDDGGPAEPASHNSRATSGRIAPGSRGTSSRGTSSRNTSSRRGVSKQPTPQVSYFRSFKPRVRGTTQLQVIQENLTPQQSSLSRIPE